MSEHLINDIFSEGNNIFLLECGHHIIIIFLKRLPVGFKLVIISKRKYCGIVHL